MAEDAALIEMEADLSEAVKVSDHGIRRMRQRLGLQKHAVAKEVDRAFAKGTSRVDLSGRMRRVLDAMFHRNGHYGDYRVYRGCVFVFKGDQFVTVIPLSNGLQNTKAGGRG